QILAALEKHHGVRARAAKELGLGSRAVHFRIESMRARGTTVPESSYDGRAEGTAGTSTLYDADGKVKLQWVKDKPGALSPEKIAEAIREALAEVPKYKALAAPSHTSKDLLTVYPIGDHHTGMYAWGEEVGADYDLKIAERLLVSAINHLVEIAPSSEEAVIVDVGDFTHYDTIRTETVRSHNTLDADSRYHAMIRVTLRLLVACVDSALTKHKRVTIICAPGNHNDMGAAWMIESLALYYSREKRVRVMAQAGKFFYYEFGKVLLGVTHGDTGRPEKLAGVMAADRPEEWGRTQHRHWLTGHVHNKSQLELAGVTWETFRTLAPVDAWAHAAGYRSGRDMQALVYHRKYGEVARHRFDVAMMEAA
ncbi:MAG: oxidoreductase, partial [Acidobacteriales bacterium]